MRVSVFAVEDTAAQVCWSGGPPGELTWSAGPAAVTVVSTGGPGAASLSGLPPASRLDLLVSSPGAPERSMGSFTTLAPPPGRLLSRFATVNDLHIGCHRFGTLHPLYDDGRGDPPPVRCARAALSEASAWGAELIVGKGDLTDQGTTEQWELLSGLLQSAGVRPLLVEGNHDVKRRAVDGSAVLAAHGYELHRRPAAVDLDGVRVVVVPTAPWHHDEGSIHPSHQDLAVSLVADAPGAAVVAMHHYPQRFRRATMYPTGIPGPAAAPFLDRLSEANPSTIVVTGHSHRHRRHQHGSLLVAEVGSTKDFPGSWAGYAVHEGGIRQVTRRVAAPDAIEWTEQGRRVLGGVWAVWAPGLRSHRCFSHTWPTDG